MTIDLTRPEEIDWLSGEAAPPVRYSEKVSEEDVLDSAKEEIVEPLAEKLESILSPEERACFSQLTQDDYQNIARFILGDIDDEDFKSASEEVKQDLSELPPREFAERYPEELAERIVDKVNNHLIRLIARFILSSVQEESSETSGRRRKAARGSHHRGSGQRGILRRLREEERNGMDVSQP